MKKLLNWIPLMAVLLLAACDTVDDLFDRDTPHPDAIIVAPDELAGTWEITAWCVDDADTVLRTAYTLEINLDSTIQIFLNDSLIVSGDWHPVFDGRGIAIDLPGDDDLWDDFDERWSVMYLGDGELWLLDYDRRRHGSDDDDDDDDEEEDDDDDDDDDEEDDDDDDDDDDSDDDDSLNCELRLRRI
ncbi:MAG: hypothetical protein SF053_02565 [Bacteroidia bacterium]|nr:hypothetical protein [Bacteroidia bacterium]